jgi:hypothetical protein
VKRQTVTSVSRTAGSLSPNRPGPNGNGRQSLPRGVELGLSGRSRAEKQSRNPANRRHKDMVMILLNFLRPTGWGKGRLPRLTSLPRKSPALRTPRRSLAQPWATLSCVFGQEAPSRTTPVGTPPGGLREQGNLRGLSVWRHRSEFDDQVLTKVW